MAYVTRVRREQISVDELVRRVQAAEPVRASEVDRVERRVRAAVVAERRWTRGSPAHWLFAAAGGLAVLSVFVVVSVYSVDRAGDAPVLPEVSLQPATPGDGLGHEAAVIGPRLAPGPP